MAWPIVAMAGLGALTGFMGGREKQKAAEANNAWLRTPTQTTETFDPYNDSKHWLNQSIERFGQEAMYGWQPSYYGTPPPSFGGGGGANVMKGGMDQWINDPGSLGQNMSGFISEGMGNGNQFLRGAYDESMNFDPWRIDQAMSAIPGLAETPQIHQFMNQGLNFDPSSIMGMANQFASGFGGFGGGGGGGGGFNLPELGVPTNEWDKATLEGKWLNEDNPHLQALIDDFNYQTSEGYKTLDVPQLDSDYVRAGRYGSNAYATAQAMAAEKAQRAIAGNTAGILAGNYEAERGRMDSAAGRVRDIDQSKIGAAASAYGADAAAGASAYGSRMGAMSSMFGDSLRGMTDLYLGNQRNTLESILGYGDQRLKGGQMGLDAAGMATEADLARLGLLRDNAKNSMDYDVGLLGAGNDLIGTAMEGYASQGALRNQGAGQRYAADMARWQHEKDQHDYYRDAELNHYASVMDQFMGPSQAFGTRKTYGTGPGVSGGQMQYGGNPWASALLGGAGGALSGYGMMGGGGGGGGAAGAGAGGLNMSQADMARLFSQGFGNWGNG